MQPRSRRVLFILKSVVEVVLAASVGWYCSAFLGLLLWFVYGERGPGNERLLGPFAQICAILFAMGSISRIILRAKPGKPSGFFTFGRFIFAFPLFIFTLCLLPGIPEGGFFAFGILLCVFAIAILNLFAAPRIDIPLRPWLWSSLFEILPFVLFLLIVWRMDTLYEHPLLPFYASKSPDQTLHKYLRRSYGKFDSGIPPKVEARWPDPHNPKHEFISYLYRDFHGQDIRIVFTNATGKWMHVASENITEIRGQSILDKFKGKPYPVASDDTKTTSTAMTLAPH